MAIISFVLTVGLDDLYFRTFSAKKNGQKYFKATELTITPSVCEMLVHYFLCLNVQFLLIPILLFLHKTNYFLNVYPGMGPLRALFRYFICSVQNYSISSSVSGQDEPNPVLWLATRAGKIYILLTKHEGRTGRISARGLDAVKSR